MRRSESRQNVHSSLRVLWLTCGPSTVPVLLLLAPAETSQPYGRQAQICAMPQQDWGVWPIRLPLFKRDHQDQPLRRPRQKEYRETEEKAMQNLGASCQSPYSNFEYIVTAPTPRHHELDPFVSIRRGFLSLNAPSIFGIWSMTRVNVVVAPARRCTPTQGCSSHRQTLDPPAKVALTRVALCLSHVHLYPCHALGRRGHRAHLAACHLCPRASLADSAVVAAAASP